MLELHFRGAAMGCQDAPDDMKELVIVDPQSGISVHALLPPEAAKEIGNELLSTSGIVRAGADALKDLGI
jgi:hypothetical protein